MTDEQLEQAQVAIAKAAIARFELSADVLAFDTTNFDTHIDTQTPGELARRGHAKSKRKDLRVVGLGLLVSETGHVPLLYRTYPGNGSDQAVLAACLAGLAQLHEALDSGEGRKQPAQRTVVRDGGFWSPQLELDLDAAGYYSLISLPLGHKAAQEALQMAAQRGAMKPLSGKLSEVRAARVRTTVGELDRTLVVVESQELLEGQKGV
ncbi:transposase [Cupriavidus sp. D39]|uniref:transposase n=1 Tax=Cupriavidus sp. D39 TaxID=2997877 RepID=UPI002271FF2E|nr:transposase [Cupriavidus sp. D39]MCY0858780.1 transposase [Cupriavidus sp. D39]